MPAIYPEPVRHPSGRSFGNPMIAESSSGARAPSERIIEGEVLGRPGRGGVLLTEDVVRMRNPSLVRVNQLGRRMEAAYQSVHSQGRSANGQRAVDLYV